MWDFLRCVQEANIRAPQEAETIAFLGNFLLIFFKVFFFKLDVKSCGLFCQLLKILN